MHKKGFTLIEILAVIVVLGTIMLIVMPRIIGIFDDSKKSAFQVEVNSVIDVIQNKMIDNPSLTIASFTLDYIKNNLNVDTNNFESISVTLNNNKVYVVIVGKNDWKNLTAYGTYNNILVSTDGLPPTYTDETCFTFNSVSQKITKYSASCPKDVIIPPTIGGVNVLIIDGGSFSWLDITSVVFPSTLTDIYGSSFNGNKLTSVIIPNSVITIGDDAFSWNGTITNVDIGTGITTIGYSAFEGNLIPQGSAIIRKSSGGVTVSAYAFNNNGADGATTITPTYQP